MTNRKGSVLFVLDQPNWAFDNIYKSISPGLSKSWVFEAVYVSDYPNLVDLLDEILFGRSDDIVHFFWRTALADLMTPNVVRRLARRKGMTVPQVGARVVVRCMSFSIYDHLYLRPAELIANRPVFRLVDGYSVSSALLREAYGAIDDYPPPTSETPDGVDVDFYHPTPGHRFMPNGALRVGWVGNSRWGVLEGMADAKGVHGVLLPAIDLVRKRGIPVELLLIDRAERWRPRTEVAALYVQMDVLVCTSLVEGTPNPVLEAMASGIAVISTNVGIVSEVLGPAQRDLVVERSPAALADAIARLSHEPETLAMMGRENRQRALGITWESRVPTWLEFLDKVLAAGGRADALERRQQAFRGCMERRHSSPKDAARAFFRRFPRTYRAVARLYHMVLLSVAALKRKAGRFRGNI